MPSVNGLLTINFDGARLPSMKDETTVRAIELAGGPSALGRELGVSKQAVSQWERIPADKVWPVVNIIGGQIQPHELRPDIFPPPKRGPRTNRERRRG